MTHRDSPLGSDIKWRPSLLSDASCCSQLVQLGLEKDRETEGLSNHLPRQDFLYCFWEDPPFSIVFSRTREIHPTDLSNIPSCVSGQEAFESQINHWYVFRTVYQSSSCNLYGAWCYAVRLLITNPTNCLCARCSSGREVWYGGGGGKKKTPRCELKCEECEKSVLERKPVCEVKTRSRVTGWNAAFPSSSRCAGWLTLLMTSVFCMEGGRWDVSKRRRKITRRTFYSCWQ